MESQPVTQSTRSDGHEGWAHLRGSLDTAEFETNPWAWVDDEETDELPVDVSGCVVTAVLVTMDAARWLPGTLSALAGLTHKPARLIAIDNASTDATRVLLDRAHSQGLIDAVYSGRRSYGFGEAVSAALAADEVSAAAGSDTVGIHAVSATDSRWIWLLHDDAAPAPDTLYRLLVHVVEEPSIGVTGPKLLLPQSRPGNQRLGEVGVSISGTGHRELELEPGEIDQGQRDEPRRRLGVSTCGMLVRADVWTELGGLDPGVPVFRDGVEFGWRATLHGYRVVTTPSARITHRQVGRAGLRPKSAIGRRPAKTDRQLGMLVVLAHTPAVRLPLVWLRLVWSCLLHAVGYVLGKVPGRAVDELAALGGFVAHPGTIRAARRRIAAVRRADGAEDVVVALRPPWWASMRIAAEAVVGLVSDRYRSVAGESDVVTLDELTGDDFAAVAEERPRNLWLSPVVLAVVALVAASLVAARRLYGTGVLAGSALLPAPSHLSDAWRAATEPIAGAPLQSSPPWLALMALGASIFAGQPDWFVSVLILGIVPLSLLAAYPVTRHVIGSRRVRVWVATTYALLPVLLGGSNQGRIVLSVVALSLPLLALAARAVMLRRVRTPEAWRGGWGAGVVLTVLIAFEPSMVIFALLAGAAGALVLRRAPRKIGRIGIAFGVPLLLLTPWWPSVISAPGRLFAGPDAGYADVAGAAPTVWHLLLGRGLGSGLPPLWLSVTVVGVIWVAAALGIYRQPRRRAVLAAWVTALLALAMAVVLSRLVVHVPPTASPVRPWVGSYVLIAFAALTLAAGAGLDALAAELRTRSFSWQQPASVLAGALVGVVTLTGAGWWVWAGARGPIERTTLDTIPSYVLNEATSGTRILAIDLTRGRASYFVIADDQVRLGDADRGYTFGGSEQARSIVRDLVVRLVAGTADADLAPQLRDLGIGYVFVSGADSESQARIDNTPGLGAASGNEHGTVWQLQPVATRASVLAGQAVTGLGPSPQTLPAGGAGRVLLRLGEAADRRWQATLDGERLTPMESGWQQGFALPAGAGTVRWSLHSGWGWLMLAQAAGLLVVLVLAAPAVRRPDLRDPVKAARRAAIGTEIGE